MGRRQEAAEAAKAAIEEMGGVPKELQAAQVRKGGTAKWKKGSKVLVPHVGEHRGLCGAGGLVR